MHIMRAASSPSSGRARRGRRMGTTLKTGMGMLALMGGSLLIMLIHEQMTVSNQRARFSMPSWTTTTTKVDNGNDSKSPPSSRGRRWSMFSPKGSGAVAEVPVPQGGQPAANLPPAKPVDMSLPKGAGMGVVTQSRTPGDAPTLHSLTLGAPRKLLVGS